jgi:propanol-preferring alcohol dehydrogenase
MELGAAYFVDFATDDVAQRVRAITKLGAHAVVCAAGSASAYEVAIHMLRNCGTLVCVGIPPSSYRMSVNPFEMIVNGIVIVVCTVGNKEEMENLLDLAVQGIIVPHVELSDFDEVNTLMKRLDRFKVAGRGVLNVPQ